MSYLPRPGSRADILIDTMQTDSVGFAQATGKLLTKRLSEAKRD